jgi:L-ascorbate metabolism protein UlaG (beta-lactamase superfamily)
MIEPALADEAFLADIEAAARDRREALHLWWLGQSGFLVAWQGRHLLLDPYLSDSLTAKYAQTDKPHARMTRRVVAPERLAFVDVVTSSHNHTDHLDGETLRPLLAANPHLAIVVPEANRAFAAERIAVAPSRLLGIDEGRRVEVAGFALAGVASAHEEVERDEHGRCRFLGHVVEAGGWRIYHSGDTVWHPGLEPVLRPHRVDVALLPINGRAPERRVAGNLSGPEAARLAHAVAARLVVPCHYEMFAFNTASPAAFVEEAERLGQPYRVLRAGERLTLDSAAR